MNPKVKTGIDFDDPLTSRSYRLKPTSHAGVKLGRIIADKIEGFISKRGSVGDNAIYEFSTFSWAQKIEKRWRDIRSASD
ncbi:hypothetical protein N8843_02245 [Verrucomicrobia bacterium]|nr:hypothetical protein [Verrucomicrobiota bacterium]MDA7660201.1 hypothetical protein [Verrucomicrobiota bacterium]